MSSLAPLLAGTIARSDWFPLDTYLENLRRAAAGVVRVDTGAENVIMATGWLVTGSLVVVPAFALGPSADEVVRCHVQHLDEPVRARVEYRPDDAVELSGPVVRPALLRLAVVLPDAALPLHLASPEVGEALVMLHHPSGALRLQVGHGRVVEVGPAGLAHDVASESGSAGGALLSAATGGVLGMHWGRPDPVRGQAMSLAQVLDLLVDAPAWSEIAEHNRLGALGPQSRVPTTGAPGTTENSRTAPGLLSAALTWAVDPDLLPASERDALRPLVADPDAGRWSLPSDERRALIEAAGSADALRAAYRPVPDPGPADRALQRIVTGSTLDLARVPDDELPYFLPVTGWLSRTVADLPAPPEVNRELERRRIRSRLRAVATDRLRGRAEELAALRLWAEQSDPSPLLVTGIGGMGKSALIARFVLDLPAETVILWLDFDRADLAPDNAVSVLTALLEQLVVQRDGLAVPTLDASSWPAVARWVGTALGRTPAVLTLDGFEVAQHVQRHDELWEVLDAVVSRASGTRVIVSGRAPVANLVVAGRPAELLPLQRLSTTASRGWLVERGVRTGGVLESVLRITDGVPLLLKLALRLVESGGDVATLPQSLRRELVEGYLYQRILDRVVDARIRPLTHDALLLRRISADLVREVLADRVPADLDPDEAVRRLTREMAVVEAIDVPVPAGVKSVFTPGVLRLRPEVRVATLRLLETEDRDRVQAIDRRVAEWYLRRRDAATEPDDQVAAAAEAVYHFVRAGDRTAAEAAWLDGSATYLLGADRDVPERFEAARRWLAAKVGGSPAAGSPVSTTVTWETVAVERIRNAFVRGLDRTIPAILRERVDRSPDSPLVIYDAWVERERGNLGGALRLLKDAEDRSGSAGWAIRVVRARTAVLAGDLLLAEQMLRWTGSAAAAGSVDLRAAAVAARIRLGVDIRSELRAVLPSEGDDATGFDPELHPAELAKVVRSVLVPWDLVVPPVRRLTPDAHVVLPSVPTAPGEAAHFAVALDRMRERLLGVLAPNARLDVPEDPGPSFIVQVDDGWSWADRLARLSRLRWRAALDQPFFEWVRSPLVMGSRLDQLQLSTLATLGALYPENLAFTDGLPLVDLIQLAAASASATSVDAETARRIDAGRALLGRLATTDPTFASSLLPTLEAAGERQLSWAALPAPGWRDGTNALVLLVLGPDPLEQLERRVLGRSELETA